MEGGGWQCDFSPTIFGKKSHKKFQIPTIRYLVSLNQLPENHSVVEFCEIVDGVFTHNLKGKPFCWSLSELGNSS